MGGTVHGEHDEHRAAGDARVGTIGGGTSEIMRTIIAKQMGF